MILLAKIADSLLFWWLTIYGFWNLYHGQVFEACALICTAVFWQRFEKARLLEALRAQKSDGEGV